MAKVSKTVIEQHGSLIAVVEWWLNKGRFDDQNTAWGYRLELYRDGTSYRRKAAFQEDLADGFTLTLGRRQKWETLMQMAKDYASWKDFKDAWLAMQRNLDRTEVSVAQAKKDG